MVALAAVPGADIRIPLLIAQGANDPRVKQAESEQIVAALADAGIDYEYMLFPDEGHGFARPENRLKFYAAAERFLARHLGGRYEGPARHDRLRLLPRHRPGVTSQLLTRLPVRVVDVYRRQVLDLLLGEVEPDTVVDAGHGTDRDGHFFTAPHVPLLEEHVGHVVAVRVDDQPLDFPDVAVGGMDVLTAAHLHLVQWDGVVGDRLRDVSPGRLGPCPRRSRA